MKATTAEIIDFPIDSDIQLKELMSEIETFAPEILWKHWYNIYDGISEVKRAGWIRKQVGIPHIYAETVLEHSLNLKTAAEAVITWTPEIITDTSSFPTMWKVHDMPESFQVLPDITPHDTYTKHQKQILEKYAVLFIETVLWDQGQKEVSLLREYIDQETVDAKNMHILDKIDAWIKALDYEKLGFKKEVSLFHPYTQEKISHHKYFTKIYEIMLEREFSHLPAHFQYFMLLEFAWDYDRWRKEMNVLKNKK